MFAPSFFFCGLLHNQFLWLSLVSSRQICLGRFLLLVKVKVCSLTLSLFVLHFPIRAGRIPPALTLHFTLERKRETERGSSRTSKRATSRVDVVRLQNRSFDFHRDEFVEWVGECWKNKIGMKSFLTGGGDGKWKKINKPLLGNFSTSRLSAIVGIVGVFGTRSQ